MFAAAPAPAATGVRTHPRALSCDYTLTRTCCVFAFDVCHHRCSCLVLRLRPLSALHQHL